MDGTEWQIGSFKLHVLVLAAQVKGVAVPVYFKVYQHKGVLGESDRIKFIRKAFVIIDLEGRLLIADREFIGKEWFAFLVEFKLNFIVRLKKGVYRDLFEISRNSYSNLEKKHLKRVF